MDYLVKTLFTATIIALENTDNIKVFGSIVMIKYNSNKYRIRRKLTECGGLTDLQEISLDKYSYIQLSKDDTAKILEAISKAHDRLLSIELNKIV